MGVLRGRQFWRTTAAALRHTAAACLGASPPIPARLCSELYHFTCTGASHAEGGGQGHLCAPVHCVGWQEVSAGHVRIHCVTRRSGTQEVTVPCGISSVFANVV